MKSKLNVRVLVVVAGATALAASSLTLAQGVGNIGQLPVIVPPSGPNSWNVTDPNGGPLPVVRDPLGPVWHKDLFGGAAGINGGQIYSLHEFLVVAGNLPWTDYHEDILTPGWNWTNPQLLVNGVVPAGYSVNNTGPSISFFFNSIAPGSLVDIRKDLVYTGPVPAAFTSIAINQWPTPEPASLLLISGAGAFLLRRPRRTFVAVN